MVNVATWIYENWEMFTAIGVLLIVLGLSGNLTRMVRSAKEGLKEAFTPLGFVILLLIAYIAYRIYLAIAATI